VRLMFELLFEKYFRDLESGNEESDVFGEFLEGMSQKYITETSNPEMVRDFIAGMTDEYFLSRCHKHLIPQITPTHL